MKSETRKLCNTTLSASFKIPAIWYTQRRRGESVYFRAGYYFSTKEISPRRLIN